MRDKSARNSTSKGRRFTFRCYAGFKFVRSNVRNLWKSCLDHWQFHAHIMHISLKNAGQPKTSWSGSKRGEKEV